MHRSETEAGIAIVGAGIAGLTLAAALSRSGLSCELFEQAPQLREVGAGVQLSPNATRVLHRLGLAERLRSVAVRPEAIELRRWDDGSVLARTMLGETCEQVFGAPYYTVHRADLHRILSTLLPAGSVRLGRRCLGVREQRERAELRLSDETVSTKVIVGADGIRSAVRGSLLPDDRPRFSGQTVYRAVVPADAVGLPWKDPRVRIWLGPRQHCVCYPVSGGEQLNVVATTPAQEWHEESWTAEGRREDLVAAYTGWNEEVRRILDSVGAVNRWALHDRDPVERWSGHRITLAGDAAHPMLPFMAQGANMAIEDAIALAVWLRESGVENASEALRGYEAARQSRTALVQRMSRANATALHFTEEGEERPREPSAVAEEGLREKAWLFGYDAESAAAAPPVG